MKCATKMTFLLMCTEYKYIRYTEIKYSICTNVLPFSVKSMSPYLPAASYARVAYENMCQVGELGPAYILSSTVRSLIDINTILSF